MKLFNSHSEILSRFAHFGDLADDMLDFLERKLQDKGFGNVVELITCRPDKGTHETPIFSGKFKCSNGDVEVKCVHRKCKKKKAHWAVYINGETKND